MDIFKKFISILLVCSLLQLVTAEKYKCPPKDLDRLDEVSARIISLSQHQRKFPETRPQVKPFCKGLREDVESMGGLIEKCLTGSARNFGKVISFSYNNMVKHYCSGAKKQTNTLMLMAKCINPIERKGETCVNKYINALHGGKRAQPQTDRIGYACCDYFKMLTCLESVTKPSCSSEATNAIQEFVRNIFNGIVDFSCGDFLENSDRCDKLPSAPKKRKSEKQTRTYFLPLVELWNHL